MPLPGVEQRDLHRGCAELRQHRHQITTVQVRLHALDRRLNQSESPHARQLISIGAVDRHAARHRQLPGLAFHLVQKPVRPRTQYADVMHHPVLRQVFECFGNPVARQVRRARAVDHGEITHATSDHRLVRLRPHAQHAIKTLPKQIDSPVSGADFQFQVGVARHEFRQLRHHHLAGQKVRHVDANPPNQRGRVLAKQALDVVHV